MPHFPGRAGSLAAGLALAALLAAALLAQSASALTGVCPDGSIFIVQTASAIPCAEAKRVDPHDVPPIQPDLLPRPYGWERFNQRTDPNNPYNMIDATPDGVAAPVATAAPPAPEPFALPGPVAPPAPATPERAAFTAPRSLALGLSHQELADLDALVSLMQQVAPATVARHAEDGARDVFVELAVSSAFEGRVRDALVRRGDAAGGPVVLFRAEARVPGAFHGNLTFVQGHIAFHPDPENPAQLGVLDGALGELAPGARVLGYAVLPPHLDPGRPLDVYWDDRRITATLAPR